MAKVVFKSMRGVKAVTMWRSFTLDGEDLTPTERAVSNLLALHYSSQSGYAYPSRETLAEHLGITVRSVTRAIKGLREKEVWGVVIGRGGIYKGKGASVSSRYYPSARIVQRQIDIIKDEKVRAHLTKTIIPFTVYVDSLTEDGKEGTVVALEEEQEQHLPPPQTEPLFVEENQISDPVLPAAEAERETLAGNATKTEGNSLSGKYSGIPLALAAALTTEEAKLLLSCSQKEQDKAFLKVNTVVAQKGALALAVAIRQAVKAARVPPSQHKQGWAGWITTFGLKHVPEEVHPLYNTLNELGEFTSLLEDITGKKTYGSHLNNSKQQF